MRREATVFSVLVPFACLVILVTTCSPSFGWQFGRWRNRYEEPPAPKPPTPPLGATIRPLYVPRPLPDPIPGPPVPEFGLTLHGSSQERPGFATPDAQSHPELSPAMVSLRDGVRRTLQYYYNRPLNTKTNMPGDLIHFCAAYGRDAQVRIESKSTKMVNGVGVLCLSHPCGGRYLLNSDGQQFVPRIGYGLQSRPSQFLAMLATTGVSPEYEIQVGEARGTVADLVRWEQLDIRGGNDLSFAAIGLAHYLPDGATWQNALGESWSLDRLLGEELDREADLTGPAGVDRLIGLSYVVNRGQKPGTPPGGRFAQTEQYLGSFQDHALKLQNADGTWNARYFGYRGTSPDAKGTLRSTGHILQWLAMSLPDDRLEDPQIVKAVAKVNSVLAGQSSRLYVSSMSPRDIATWMRALHALSIYDQRVFVPRDPPPEPEEAEVASVSVGR